MKTHLVVSLTTQTLSVYRDTVLRHRWQCSTSKLGVGFGMGSNQTPLGRFQIAEKVGDGAHPLTIFKARCPVGQWCYGEETHEDLILSRILWLDGLDGENANTKDRYIYFHGTNEIEKIGKPASHGCVRLCPDDMVLLFDRVQVGDKVTIEW